MEVDKVEKKDPKVSSFISGESVKFIAETARIAGVPDDAAAYVGEDATYRLNLLVQTANKFRRLGKRKTMSGDDFAQAMTVFNEEPLYGFEAKKKYQPFRHAVGGGREVHFYDDKEVDLDTILNSTAPKLPQPVSLTAHWLAIEGVQPAVPQNPAPVSKHLQKLEALDPSIKQAISKPKRKISNEPGKAKHRKGPETVMLKEITTHELSVEQQFYYKEVTEACVGSDETRRAEALNSLATDHGLCQILPRFSIFVYEGVKVNVVQNNLALLIYLMRMVKSLMDNTTLYLEKYLHELIPTIVTCVVSRQLCGRPDADNHWALRDFAGRLIAQLCKAFSTNTNNIQPRIIKTFCKALLTADNPMATQYGALSGLGEMGQETIKTFVLPNVKMIGERLQFAMESPLTVNNNVDKIAGEHVKNAMIKNLWPLLKTLRSEPDNVEEYKADYGYLGQGLHAAVVKERLREKTASAATASTSSSNSNPFKHTITMTQPRAGSIVLSGSSTPTALKAPMNRFTTPTSITATSTPQLVRVVQTGRPNTQQVFSTATSMVKVVGQQTPGQSAQKLLMLPMNSGGSSGGGQGDMGLKNIFNPGT